MKTSLLTIVLLMAVPATALAYLNPESGTMLIQALLGGIAGAAVISRLYWARIRAYFKPAPKVIASEPPRDA